MPIPEFIVDLRRRIGDTPLWLMGTAAIVVRAGQPEPRGRADARGASAGPDEILFVRRSDNGQWAPVTGIVDPGEHPATTAVRECMEETRVEAEIERLVLVDVSEPKTHANGDKAQYVELTFRMRWVEGDGEVGDDESTDVRWFAADALPEMSTRLARAVEAVLADEPECRLIVNGVDLPITPARGRRAT
ncbi:MAG: NUDIX hydrolase [Pseudoclavibacter sp.]